MPPVCSTSECYPTVCFLVVCKIMLSGFIVFSEYLISALCCKSTVEPPMAFGFCVAPLASEPLAERHEMSGFVQLCVLMATSFADLPPACFKTCLRLSKCCTDITVITTGVALSGNYSSPTSTSCKRGYNLSFHSMQRN